MSPLYECLEGHVVLTGFAPDGDSVRFLPNDPSKLANLRRGSLLRPSTVDGSVQLRLQGIDAPELHYALASQPRAAGARDALMAWLGVQAITYAADAATVMTADPPGVPAVVLADTVDARGRVIAYLLRRCPGTSARRHHVDTSLLAETANHALLAAGHVYFLAYTSLPVEHRRVLRDVARAARARKLGVWSADATKRGFLLRGVRSLAPGGALVFPKLFRRCVDYVAQRYAYGFAGTFVDWLEGHGSAGMPVPDRVVVKHAANVLLSSLVREHDRRIALAVDLNDLVFVEE